VINDVNGGFITQGQTRETARRSAYEKDEYDMTNLGHGYA